MPIVHGASGCSLAYKLRDQLACLSQQKVLSCERRSMAEVMLVVAVVVMVVSAPPLSSNITRTDQSGDESGTIAAVSEIMQL